MVHIGLARATQINETGLRTPRRAETVTRANKTMRRTNPRSPKPIRHGFLSWKHRDTLLYLTTCLESLEQGELSVILEKAAHELPAEARLR